ncbi:MAG: GOLPH3/VPS74 family protein [Actinophytocola sp.]|uniref:GOLPH3/VPS74 family protein n=1 Tax=Actinophytocola sp. TaxID=1872138 RepID=UPI003D6B3990
MLLAEELLLLALDDGTGKNRVSNIEKGLAGAVLLELALLDRVRVTEKGEQVRAGRLVLRPGPAPEHPVLVTGLEVLANREGRKPQHVIDALAKRLRERLTDGMVDAGVLRREWRKTLGLFPSQRLFPQDTAHRSTVRKQVRTALDGAKPDERTAALIALVSALNAVTTVFDVRDRRAARRRAKEIAEGSWAATAVRKAVEAVYAATTAAVVASTAASGGDGGGG